MKLSIKLKKLFKVLDESVHCYPAYLKQSYPFLILGILLTIFLRGNLVFDLVMLLANVFLLGVLFMKGNDVLMHEETPWKTLFAKVWQRYLPSLALGTLLTLSCLVAMFLPGYLYYLLPNSILAMFVNPIVLGVSGLLGLIVVGPYLFFSVSFFWLENQSVLQSMQSSYDLVKGQWLKVAMSLLFVTLCFAIPTALLMALALCLLSKVMFFGVILLIAVVIVTLPLWILFPISFYKQVCEKAL